MLRLPKVRTKLLRVSSRDRDATNPNQTNANFTVEIPDYATNKVLKIENVYASCPNVFTNINETNNTISFYRRRAGDIFDFYTRQIPVGQYTITDLLPELTTALSTVIGGSLVVTATYNTTTGRIELTATGTTFDYIRLTSGGTPGTYAQSPLDPVIGNNTNDIILEGAGAVSLNLPPNLTGISEIYIHSQKLSPANTAEAQGTFSALDVLSLTTTPYGGVASHYYKDPDMHQVAYAPFKSVENLTDIDIKLRDSEGNLLILPDNFHFTLIVRLHYQ
jgi:hypothetical protein